MNILNNEITEHTTGIIEKLASSFRKNVTYIPLSKDACEFGAADYYSNESLYIIYLSTKITGNVFETNLLHELFHIVQIESNFPVILTKTNQIYSSDKAFFDDLARRIQSSVLDLEVNNQLLNHGYNSNYFVQERFYSLKNILNNTYNFEDKYNHAHFSIQFILFLLLASQEQINFITPLLDMRFKNVTKKAIEMSSQIYQIGFNTPIQVAKCFEYTLTELNLWDICCLNYNNVVLKTKTSFSSYFDSL